MKRLFLLLAFAVCTVASAQQYTFRQAEEGFKKAYLPQSIRIVPGVQEGQVLTVEPKFNMFHTIKGIRIKLFDSELKEIQSIEIGDMKHAHIEHATRIGDNLHVVMGCVGKRNFYIKHLVVDATTLEVKSDSLLLNIDFSKKEDCYYRTVTSPNGQNLGVVYSLVDEKAKQAQTKALLFDNTMHKVWEQSLYYGALEQILLTDRGELVTSTLVEDSESDGTVMLYNAADASGVKHGECVVKDDIQQMTLLQYAGGKVLATALEQQGGGLLSKALYTGYHVYLFDMNEERLAVDNRHPFSGDDIRVLENEEKVDLTFLKTNHVCLMDQISTPWGGAVLYHRMWMEGFQNMRTGASSEKVYSKGILVVNVDTLGNIVWSRGIMQNNQNASWPAVGADIFLHNGNLCVVTNESKKETDEYTPTQPAKSSSSFLLANCALSIYSFTPEGQGSKKMLATDGKFMLFSPVCAAENGIYYLLTGGYSPQMSRLTIR